MFPRTGSGEEGGRMMDMFYLNTNLIVWTKSLLVSTKKFQNLWQMLIFFSSLLLLLLLLSSSIWLLLVTLSGMNQMYRIPRTVKPSEVEYTAKKPPAVLVLTVSQINMLVRPALYICPPQKSARGIITIPRAPRIAIITVLSLAEVTSPMYPYMAMLRRE